MPVDIQSVAIIPNAIIPTQTQIPVSNGGALLIDSITNVITVDSTVSVGVLNPLQAPLTPPGLSDTQSRTMSIPEKSPSIESPGSTASTPSNIVDWAIKGPVKLKYTQIFNTTDRTRTGYLTGAQARNLLLQSKLPQATLAQIWALADIDSDGRLGCDEFILAMYLCEMASQGEVIPAKLSNDLIPPSFRKSVISRQGSVISRHGSISSQSGSSTINLTDTDVIHTFNQTTFEDKRKENFDKGQAELDRRRKVLQGRQATGY